MNFEKISRKRYTSGCMTIKPSKKAQEFGRQQVTYLQDSPLKLTILQQKPGRPEGSGKTYS